jgi:hypothetical protein
MANEDAGARRDTLRLSADWWAFLVALIVVALVRAGLLGGVPW